MKGPRIPGTARPEDAGGPPASIGGDLAIPFAGGTPASGRRAVPKTPCPRAFARGVHGENPTEHMPRSAAVLPSYSRAGRSCPLVSPRVPKTRRPREERWASTPGREPAGVKQLCPTGRRSGLRRRPLWYHPSTGFPCTPGTRRRGGVMPAYLGSLGAAAGASHAAPRSGGRWAPRAPRSRSWPPASRSPGLHAFPGGSGPSRGNAGVPSFPRLSGASSAPPGEPRRPAPSGRWDTSFRATVR